MKSTLLALILLGSLLSSCKSEPKAQGFGPIPHEKDVEQLIDKAE